jgi:hypothetical protein
VAFGDVTEIAYEANRDDHFRNGSGDWRRHPPDGVIGPCGTDSRRGEPPDSFGRTTSRQEKVDTLALFKARDYAGSLKLWQEVVKNNAALPPAQVIMAHLYADANMPKEAQKALEQAVQDVPDDPERYALLADCALQDGDPRLSLAPVLEFALGRIQFRQFLDPLACRFGFQGLIQQLPCLPP